MKKKFSRRNFITSVTGASLATAISGTAFGKSHAKDSFTILHKRTGKLAILGGQAVRAGGRIGPKWPYVDEKMVDSIVKTTRSGVWSRIQRNSVTPSFESSFASLIGTKYCVGTGSGTQALSTCVFALNIGPGDEVITSPYTDFGTIASILASHALPVLVDIEPDTYQLDPAEVEKKVNENTRAIMPVHIFGAPCNMEKIMQIAKKHDLIVIEDACQAPLARYQGKGLGTIGDLGCFSFQASKPIACGEGGAVVGNNEKLMDQCYTVQNRGASRRGTFDAIGPKYRMEEFEASILNGQLPGVKERFEKRNANANYLRGELKDFSALQPQRYYPGTESSAYYHFSMTYNKDLWGVDRATFLKAVRAEGVGLGSYIPYALHREPWIDNILKLKSYKTMYSASRLKEYKAGMDLQNCDKIIKETMVSFAVSGPLLADRKEMKNIINAIMKVYENRDKLRSI
jgi:dTDP-4-amino-4,6-dideoxygalactose transaminase